MMNLKPQSLFWRYHCWRGRHEWTPWFRMSDRNKARRSCLNCGTSEMKDAPEGASWVCEFAEGCIKADEIATGAIRTAKILAPEIPPEKIALSERKRNSAKGGT